MNDTDLHETHDTLEKGGRWHIHWTVGRKVEVLLAAKGGYTISHVLVVTPMDEWLYPLVLLGAGLSLFVRPRRAWHGRLLLWIVIVSQVLVCLLANAEARYRLPLMPFLALLAAWALWGTAQWAAERWWPMAPARPLPVTDG